MLNSARESNISSACKVPLQVSNVEVKVTTKMFKVNFSSAVSGTFSYIVLQGFFPITHRDTNREKERRVEICPSLLFLDDRNWPDCRSGLCNHLSPTKL